MFIINKTHQYETRRLSSHDACIRISIMYFMHDTSGHIHVQEPIYKIVS